MLIAKTTSVKSGLIIELSCFISNHNSSKVRGLVVSFERSNPATANKESLNRICLLGMKLVRIVIYVTSIKIMG